MKCPSCNSVLLLTIRDGIEIDYCAECKGVWLDRGELDEIIKRSTQYIQNLDNDQQKYKKENFFTELFDF